MGTESTAPTYSPRLDEAVALVLQDFRFITRKGTATPYLSHLFAVMSLVAEGGGDEDQMIAALLHDWLEDVPHATKEALEARFGARVARIVLAVSDTTQHPKPPWRERKEAFLLHIADQPDEVKLVCCADKLHNTQTLVRDLQRHGPATMDRFRGGREGTVWYYSMVASALGQEGWQHFLLRELDEAVRKVQQLASAR